MPSYRSRPADALIDFARQVQRWGKTQIKRWTPQLSDSGRELTGTTEQTAIAGLHADEPRLRWEACVVLSKDSQRSPEAVSALVQVLADPEPFVRWQAAKALAAQEAGRVFTPLSQALASSDPLSRAGAAEALGYLGGEAASVELRKKIGDADPQVRIAMIEALGKCGDPTSIAHLEPLLEDENTDVRRAAAHALGQLGNTAAAAALARSLAQADQPLLVRRALAAALARVPHPKVQPTLMAALADPDPQVRGYAVQALGQVGNEAAWTALTEITSDDGRLLSGTVGDAAQRAIALLERRGRQAPPTPQAGPADDARQDSEDRKEAA